MKNKNALIGMIITTLIFAALLLWGLSSVNPGTSGPLGFIWVTAALLLFVWGALGTLMLAHRAIRKKDRAVAVSLRQASFLSIVIVIALYLSRFELLTWWNVIVLVILVVLVEIFFIGKEEIK